MDNQGPTISELVANGRLEGDTVDLADYTAAVTAAGQLAKALADIMPRKLPNGSYGNGKYANAAALLDRLDPGWRERVERNEAKRD